MRKELKESLGYLNYSLGLSMSCAYRDVAVDLKALEDDYAGLSQVYSSPNGIKQLVICLEHYYVYISARKNDRLARVAVEPVFGKVAKRVPPDISVILWLTHDQIDAFVRRLSTYKY